jgi:hypothetical protein
MILDSDSIEAALTQAREAFPLLGDWEFTNIKDSNYFGFSMWGRFVLDRKGLQRRVFFITLDTFEETWSGHLTSGQHSYLWSSTDEGDAHLLGTERFPSLEAAISRLKEIISCVFQALS